MVLLCHLLLLLLLKAHSTCPKSHTCGNFSLEFPFTVSSDPGCGLIIVDGCDSAEGPPTLHTRVNTYQIIRKTSTNAFLIHNSALHEALKSPMCITFTNQSLPESPFVSYTFSPNITFFTCYDQTVIPQIHDYFQGYRSQKCNISTIYYQPPSTHKDHALPYPQGCFLIQLPIKSDQSSGDILQLLNPDYTLEWNVSQDCNECYHGGGQCLNDNQNQFYCSKKEGISFFSFANYNISSKTTPQ